MSAASSVGGSGGKAPFPSDQMLLTALLENVPDHIYFKDRESRFIAVTASLAAHLGVSRTAIIGKTDFDFYAEARARLASDAEQNILRTGQPIVGKLEKETWPDGRVSWILRSKFPLRNEQGEIVGTIGLSKDVTESKQLERDLDKAQKELLESSRLADMAEVATGVLHNVGNVLNSVNVSASVIATGLRQSKADSLGKIATMLREHAADLGAFLTQDSRGRLIPQFVESYAQHAVEERTRMLTELDALQKNIDHIKEIVGMQQAYATMMGIVEPHDAVVLMEDSIRMNSAALARHEVTVVREFLPAPPILAEKAKVLQILVNLIRNAKHAADDGGLPEKIITLRIEPSPPDRVRLVVRDNGEGIPPENLARIFTHGFTTRAKGHGFGLHSSAVAAKEMHGTLTAASEGRGKGATFVLELPAAAAGSPTSPP